MLKLTWKHIQLRIAKRTLKNRNRGWHGSLEKQMLFTTVWAPKWAVHRWMGNDWQCLQHAPLGGWYALECPGQFQLVLAALFLFQSYALGGGLGLVLGTLWRTAGEEDKFPKATVICARREQKILLSLCNINWWICYDYLKVKLSKNQLFRKQHTPYFSWGNGRGIPLGIVPH